MVSSDSYVDADGPGEGENGLRERRVGVNGLAGDRSVGLLSEDSLLGWERVVDADRVDGGMLVSLTDDPSYVCHLQQAIEHKSYPIIIHIP